MQSAQDVEITRLKEKVAQLVTALEMKEEENRQLQELVANNPALGPRTAKQFAGVKPQTETIPEAFIGKKMFASIFVLLRNQKVERIQLKLDEERNVVEAKAVDDNAVAAASATKTAAAAQ